MPYYRICPDCHAYLDFGEQCDCRRQPNSQALENPQKESRLRCSNTESGKMEIGLPANISTSMITESS